MSSSDQSGSWFSRKMASFSSGMAAFGKFVYDSEEGTVMGRNGSSWLRISVFYLGYYAFLAGLFAVSISVTQSMLSDTEPFFQTRLQYPGMSVLPLTTKFDPAAADIIYKKSERKTYVDYVNEIAKLLEPYNETNHKVGDYVKECTEPIDFTNEEKTKDKKFKSCLFDIKTLPTVCTNAEEDYGYKAGTPCIFVRLNKIINWQPVPFLDLNDPTAKGEVSRATALKDHLQTVGEYKKGTSYVVCNPVIIDGEENVGKNIKVKVIPAGISENYFPFKGKQNQPGYRSPLVAVQLSDLPTDQDKEFKMVCKVYARNLMDIMRINVGYVEFKVKVTE